MVYCYSTDFGVRRILTSVKSNLCIKTPAPKGIPNDFLIHKWAETFELA